MPHKDKAQLEQCKRDWYKNNRERILEKQRDPERREKAREALRRFKAKNREKVLAEKREGRRKAAEKEGKSYRSREDIAADIERRRAGSMKKKILRHWNKATEYMRLGGMKRSNWEYHNKHKLDPQYMINMRIRNAIRKSLRMGDQSASIEPLLGYTTAQIKEHLEGLFSEGMTWALFLEGKIHIDHRMPKSWFKYETTDDQNFRDCWAMSNLKPMWAADNMRKSNKYCD